MISRRKISMSIPYRLVRPSLVTRLRGSRSGFPLRSHRIRLACTRTFGTLRLLRGRNFPTECEIPFFFSLCSCFLPILLRTGFNLQFLFSLYEFFHTGLGASPIFSVAVFKEPSRTVEESDVPSALRAKNVPHDSVLRSFWPCIGWRICTGEEIAAFSTAKVWVIESLRGL